MIPEFSQVVFLLHPLLPETGPDQNSEDEDILDHLDVQLCSPVHTHKAKDANEDHQGVHRDQADNKEAFLQVPIDCGIRKLSRGQFDTPEGAIAELVSPPATENGREIHQAASPDVSWSVSPVVVHTIFLSHFLVVNNHEGNVDSAEQ